MANDFLKNTVSCTYDVVYDFEVMSDRHIIEERLAKFNFEIIQREQAGSSWTYTLERHYKADQKLFELIATDEYVELVDESGQVALTQSDIIAMEMNFEAMIIEAKDDCYKRFSRDGEPQAFYFSNGIEKVFVMDVIKQKGILKFYINDSNKDSIGAEDELYIQGIINLISKPLRGVVLSEVLSENIGMK